MKISLLALFDLGALVVLDDNRNPYSTGYFIMFIESRFFYFEEWARRMLSSSLGRSAISLTTSGSLTS